MSNQELLLVRGGSFFSATYLNAIARSINSVLELGRTVGTSIRMMLSGKKC